MERGHSGSLIGMGTAEVFAALRAAGSAERDRRIRHPDGMATRFIPWSARFTALAKVPVARRMIPVLAEWLAPGAYCYELARGRHLDRVLVEELGDGLEQLVFLGAGFETRPYRFADSLKDVCVFEVDHPVTATQKRLAVRRVLGDLPSHVRYVEVDLQSRDLGERLRAAGYRKRARTLFIWSGVTGYLTTEAVQRTLRYIANGSAPGSLVVFDYWHQAIIDGDHRFYGAAEAARRVVKMGEPYRSGVEPSEIGAFVGDCGLELVDDIGPVALRETYLRGTNGRFRGRPYGFLSFAHARVAYDGK